MLLAELGLLAHICVKISYLEGMKLFVLIIISQVTKVETISKTSTSSAGIAQKLKVLSELHESGALNKEEFEKAKKKVLEE